jgi:hypothetical protein
MTQIERSRGVASRWPEKVRLAATLDYNISEVMHREIG